MPKLWDLLKKIGEIFLLFFFYVFNILFFFLLRICFRALFIILISLFSFPASGQMQQLLRNCSRSDSCVHKWCTVALSPAHLQLAFYRNCFSLSVSLLPLLHTLADVPKHCVWRAGHQEICCLCVCDLLGKCCCIATWEQKYQKLLFH